MLVFNNYFCKNSKSKLHFGDRVAVLNVFLYQTGGSTCNSKFRSFQFHSRIWKLLGSKKSVGVPKHKVYEVQRAIQLRRETKNLQKSALTSKVVNPFTRADAPPFIGRRMDFYLPTIPSNLGNIPNVNMYTNIFYIPWFTGLILYIYKLATSSHLKPGLSRWRLWLCSFLIPESLSHEDHRLLRLPNQIFINSPNLLWSLIIAGFRFQIFASSWFQNSQGSTILKCIADSHGSARSVYHFRTLLENLKNTWNSSGSLHERSIFTKLEFSSRGWFANLSHKFRQTRRFEGVRFFP
jgi:hypothetical protein